MQKSSFSPTPKSTLREWLLLGAALAVAMGMWMYSQWVVVPMKRVHYAALGQPMDVGDLYPRWYGARALLLHHRDPYSQEVSREIQVAYYGRPLDAEGADRGRDEQRFAYPVYVVFFVAPTVFLSFAQTQIAATWLLGLLAAGSVLFWLRALQWQPSRAVKLTLITLFLSSPAIVQALRVQQLAVLVVFCLAGCAALVVGGRLFWAGGLLACATLKPQMALLPVLWFLIWATGDWKKRQGLVWGLIAALGLLIGAGEFLLPGWFREFVAGLIAYTHYAGMGSWLDLVFPPSVAMAASGVVLVVLALVCVRWRGIAAARPDFFVQLAIILTVAVITLPLVTPFNHILLMPGVLSVIRHWNLLWDRGRAVQLLCLLGTGVLAASWASAWALAMVFATAYRPEFGRAWELPFWFDFGTPPIVAGLLLVLLGSLAAQSRRPGHVF